MAGFKGAAFANERAMGAGPVSISVASPGYFETDVLKRRRWGGKLTEIEI